MAKPLGQLDVSLSSSTKRRRQLALHHFLLTVTVGELAKRLRQQAKHTSQLAKRRRLKTKHGFLWAKRLRSKTIRVSTSEKHGRPLIEPLRSEPRKARTA